jgi:hypothetical protein
VKVTAGGGAGAVASKLPLLSTRVPLGHKARVRAAAKAAGLRLSDWLRRAIVHELAREKKVIPPSTPDSPASDSDVVKETT